MGTAERRLSNLILACIVVFLFGLALNVIEGATAVRSDLLAIIGSVAMIGAIAAFAATVLIAHFCKWMMERTSSQAKRMRFAAKVDRTWVTDCGRIVGPHESDLERPRYHVVLIATTGEMIECETAPEVFRNCIEMSIGWAELQGHWLGSYVPDPELFRRYSGR